MDLDLADRIVIVAGSSRGIGAAVARAFLREGARVAVTGRDDGSLAASAKEMGAEFGSDRVLPFAGDLTDTAAIALLLEQVKREWGGLDCVVANVGRGRIPLRDTYKKEEWQATFETNFFGSVRLAEASLPMLRARKGASIVFTSSIAGIERTLAPLPYAAAKAAIIAYAKGLAPLVAPDGIRVNCVAPGNILFPGGSWEKRLREDREGTERYIRENVPQRRFGTPEEIADLVVFLSSPRSSFTTGTCFVADGGQTHSF